MCLARESYFADSFPPANEVLYTCRSGSDSSLRLAMVGRIAVAWWEWELLANARMGIISQVAVGITLWATLVWFVL